MTDRRKKLFALCFCLSACFCIIVSALMPWEISALTSDSVSRNAPLYNNLGSQSHPITTSSPQVQRYFDQGLIFTFGFNHAEAERSFREATKLDSSCAICYWGIALALGSNINAPMSDDSVPQAYEAIQKALQLADRASESEQAYIQALSKRYSPEPVADRQPLDLAYANAMREVSQRYPDDLDAATLFAESLMDLMPWNYWTEEGQPKPGTSEVIATLESVLERNPNHPGAIHYYIHAVEASSNPERAEAAADRLRNLVPGAGHLVHMPAHIYLRIGRYHDASVANESAIASDESYLDQSQAQGLYPSLYYPHNIHFLWKAASMEGRSGVAIDAARKLVAKVSPEQVRQFPLTEIFPPTPLFALVRFGKWDEVLSEPQPPEDFHYTRAMWHYARGMALTAKGRLEEAVNEKVSLRSFLNSEKIAALETVEVPAVRLIQIADHVLAGKIAEQRGQNDEAIAQFKAAVEIQDGLPYMEPPYWYYPVRQEVGAVLLKLDRPGEAEAVYREDLRQHPRNGWSLFGLAQSLHSQGKAGEAAEVQKQFEEAWSQADVRLTASRF